LTKRIIVNFLVVGISIGIIYSNFTNVLQINRFIPDFFLTMPDIFLILTVFSGIFYGSFFAMVFGFFSGLALDISSYPLIGFYSLIYCFIGFSISAIENKIDFKNAIISEILIFVYFIVKIIIFTIVGAIFLKPGDIKNYFSNIFLMQFVYTMIISIPIFSVYKKIFEKNRKNY